MAGSFPRSSAGIGYWVKEPFCGLSHGLGAVLSMIGLAFLLCVVRGEAPVIVGVSIYGLSLILLYTASCLVHSIHCSPRVERILERLDYAAIFLLIAGTYTPICLSALHGPWGWTLLSIEWGLALLGVTMVLTRGVGRTWVMLYVPMGWLVLVAAWPLIHRVQAGSIAWLLAGGVIYTLGAVVFVTKRPKLWPGRFNSHDLWHVLVLAGSACHFIVVSSLTAS